MWQGGQSFQKRRAVDRYQVQGRCGVVDSGRSVEGVLSAVTRWEEPARFGDAGRSRAHASPRKPRQALRKHREQPWDGAGGCWQAGHVVKVLSAWWYVLPCFDGLELKVKTGDAIQSEPVKARECSFSGLGFVSASPSACMSRTIRCSTFLRPVAWQVPHVCGCPPGPCVRCAAAPI